MFLLFFFYFPFLYVLSFINYSSLFYFYRSFRSHYLFHVHKFLQVFYIRFYFFLFLLCCLCKRHKPVNTLENLLFSFSFLWRQRWVIFHCHKDRHIHFLFFFSSLIGLKALKAIQFFFSSNARQKKKSNKTTPRNVSQSKSLFKKKHFKHRLFQLNTTAIIKHRKHYLHQRISAAD